VYEILHGGDSSAVFVTIFNQQKVKRRIGDKPFFAGRGSDVVPGRVIGVLLWVGKIYTGDSGGRV